jgi:3-oxoacyl-[acyl-carrier protein] reductase
MSTRGTAVVTGAGQGIGRAISVRLAADGYEVLCVDVDGDHAAATAELVGGRPARIDVSNPEQVATLAELAPNCTAIINNAAIQRYRDFLSTTVDDMRSILDINIMGPMLVAQALVPVMSANGGGSIVNLSSIVSVAHPAGSSLYPASKAAINEITMGMAVEFATFGIRCNAVAPGTVLTEGTSGHYGTEEARAAIAACLPVGRFGAPEDIANAVSWLCSAESGWVTGQVLFVDGGFTASHGQYFRAARKAAQA